MRRILLSTCTALLLTAIPAVASAQAFWVSPFIGATFGGNTQQSGRTIGVSAGGMFTKWIGAEADIADTPAFFAQDGFLIERRISTVMGNGVLALPYGGPLKVYVSGGVGVLRPHLEEAGAFSDVHPNTFGWNFGAGATFYENHTVGIRGDVRYFRGAHQSDADTNAFGVDFSKLGFWRASVGLSTRF